MLSAFLLLSKTSEESSMNESGTVSSLQDAHGLSVDRKDPTKVYIATHKGLLVMSNDSELLNVGTARDDYMGFSAHTSDPNTFYSSGHPSTGGNIGFQKSTDGGKSWQKVSDGVNGPVDFHTMTVSQANPSIIYGSYRGQLQKSDDEGKNWKLLPNTISNVIILATSPSNQDTVYAGTTNGLFVSSNQGSTWSALNLKGAVMALAVNPKSDKEIIAYTDGQGLVVSKDGSITWNKLSYEDSMVMQVAYDPQNPSTIYLINRSLVVHKTTDGGGTWKKVR